MSLTRSWLPASTLLVLLLLTGCSAASASGSPTPNKTHHTSAAVDPSHLGPADSGYDPGPNPVNDGYTDSGNGLEFQFLPTTGYQDCTPYDYCVVLQLKATQDCTNLVYVEANVLDSDKVVIDSTNATLSSLEKGEVGKLTLGSDTSGSASFKLTKMACD